MAAVKKADDEIKALVAKAVDDLEALDPGQSEFGKDDVAVPRIKILQDLSPQTKKTKPEFVEGAKPGMFFNSATERLWSGEVGVLLIPCAYRASYVEWLPDRGGFVADRSDEPGVEELWRVAFNRRRETGGQSLIANGNVLDRSHDHYVLLAANEAPFSVFTFEEAVLTLGSTQIKKSRNWNTTIQGRVMVRSDGRPFHPLPPAFPYLATTKEESNDEGTWMGIKIVPWPTSTLELGPDGRAIYDRAVAFRKLVMEGRRRAAVDQPTDDAGAGDIPF